MYYYSEVLGIGSSELAGFTLSDIINLINKVQAGLAGTEPRLTSQEIEDEAGKIYEAANS